MPARGVIERHERWRWGRAWGAWYAIQWSIEYALSLGVHVEPRTRLNAHGAKYGPYIDLHLPFTIASFGRRPIYSTDWQSFIGGRGGELASRQ